MRIAFMGTPEFAVPSLERLLADGHQVLAVVTQPDRPAGRGQRLSSPPVKRLAQGFGLPFYQPEEIREEAFYRILKDLDLEAIVVVAYGKFLPPEVLEIPKYGCFNVHASLLPKYRGAAPINWAIINGEPQTGITIMEITEQMDRGPILLQRTEGILSTDTAGSLERRLAVLGAEALSEALTLVADGKAPRRPQDEGQASYAPKLKKEDGLILWDQGARAIHNRVRGLSPWPSAYTFFQGLLVKVLESQVLREEGSVGRPGTIIEALKGQGLTVATGAGLLLLKRLQPENRRAMEALEFSRGYGVGPDRSFSSKRNG